MSQKSETNKLIEVFAYDASKYCLGLSDILALFIVVKEVFFMF